MEDISSVQVVAKNNQNQVYQTQVLKDPWSIPDSENITSRQVRPVVKRRGLIIAVAVVVATGITTAVGMWTWRQPPQYVGKFHLLIKNGKYTTQINQMPSEAGKEAELDYNTQIEVLKSRKLLNPVLQKIAPTINQEQLEIKSLDKTRIVEVSYQGTDQQKIRSVLQNIADAYVRYGLESRKTELKQGIEFVKTQLPKLNQQVNYYQEQLQKFQQKHSFLNPEQQADRLSVQLVSLQSNYLDTQLKFKQTTSLHNLLQKQLKLTTQNEAIASTSLSESPRYQNLLNQLQQVEIELAEQSVIFVEDSPVIQILKEKKTNLLSLLNQESEKILGDKVSKTVEKTEQIASPSSLKLALNQQFIQSANELEVLQIRLKTLEEQIETFQAQMKQMPVIARQYADLQRKLTIANESLGRFLDAQEKLQIEASQKAAPWELLSQPEITKKSIYPNLIQNLGLGMMGGLVLGLSVGVLTEKLISRASIQ